MRVRGGVGRLKAPPSFSPLSPSLLPPPLLTGVSSRVVTSRRLQMARAASKMTISAWRGRGRGQQYKYDGRGARDVDRVAWQGRGKCGSETSACGSETSACGSETSACGTARAGQGRVWLPPSPLGRVRVDYPLSSLSHLVAQAALQEVVEGTLLGAGAGLGVLEGGEEGKEVEDQGRGGQEHRSEGEWHSSWPRFSTDGEIGGEGGL